MHLQWHDTVWQATRSSWPILCWVECKTFTQSVNQSLLWHGGLNDKPVKNSTTTNLKPNHSNLTPPAGTQTTVARNHWVIWRLLCHYKSYSKKEYNGISACLVIILNGYPIYSRAVSCLTKANSNSSSTVQINWQETDRMGYKFSTTSKSTHQTAHRPDSIIGVFYTCITTE